MTRSLTTLSLCLIGMTLAPAVLAQTKSSVEVNATTGALEFRDPKTGQVWTPETVGQDGKPIGPEDAAFDPRDQTGAVQTVVQRATPRPVGQVPITAGPTVPIVNAEAPTLRAIAGQRWQLVMYLQNNSGNAVQPVLNCNFTNAGKPVTNTRVHVGQLGPGVRAGIVVMGPRTNFFVDKAKCDIVSP